MLANRKIKTALWLVIILAILGSHTISYADEQSPDAGIDAIAAWINQVRSQNNLQAIIIDSKLNKIAAAHSRNMADNDLLGVNDTVSGTPFERIGSAGLTDINNLVVVARASDPGLLLEQLESQESLEKILSPEMTHAGVGIESDPENNLWLTIHMTERAISFTRFRLSQSNAVPAKRSITIRGNTAYKRIKVIMFPPEGIMQDLDLEHITVPGSNGDFEIALSFGISTGCFEFEFYVLKEGEYKLKNSFSMDVL